MSLLNEIDAIVFDFDGVLTDNHVYMNSDGTEFVRCSRSDGLAFDTLKILGVKTLILSTETNTVVQARANKLNIPVIQGVKDKLTALNDFCLNKSCSLDRIWYIGNDINDIKVIKACGKSFCPSDAHPLVKDNVNTVLANKGGDAIARELVEVIIKINIYEVLYEK